jgi:NADH:ubiquinone oxidoreductase subunit 5 (subunit L)/multisubunit Na+/H+ antiporter MnhA subunit
VGVFTVFIAGISAIFEKDFKKIIALSTLSQMGFCIFTVGLGFSFLSFTHLISHALFKSCLFLLVGYIIYFYFGQQDRRSYIMFRVYSFFLQIQILVCLFCLCGLFFSRGLVSKDYILEFFFFKDISLLFVLFFFFSV